jgi:uncharacterized radical SAM superfamily Fe-S cluster-containing enzyme
MGLQHIALAPKGASKITDTKGYCVPCNAIVPAESVERDGAVWRRRHCPSHGPAEALQSRHPRWFRLIEALLEPMPNPVVEHDIRAAKHLRGLFIDVTEACNLRCPNCLVDAKDTPSGPSAKLEDAIASLDQLLPYKPVLYLTGGEPTLLPDLDRWIATLTRRGYDVKVLSNGLKLVDRAYCQHLKDAGCRWLLLQFDSPREEALSALRGRGRMADVRQQAVANLSELGFEIDLACMIDREHNLQDMAALIRLGFATRGVRHVSLMPSRRLGRGLLTTDENLLEDVDMMDVLADQTQGAIRRADWALFLAAMSAVYHTTGSPDFAPRRCFLPLPLVGTAQRFTPVTRVHGLLDPRNLEAFLQMASQGGRAEAANWSERSLMISTETFRELDTMDVGDAARCSRYYLVDGRVQQACHHNVMDRPARREQWETEHGESRWLPTKTLRLFGMGQTAKRENDRHKRVVSV